MSNSQADTPNTSVEPIPDGRNWTAITWLALGLILLARLISLHFNTTALFFDEAQYWLWGKEPAFGYFSKPPLLGWIIAAFTGVCGSDSEFCVRLASPILHTITSAFIFLSARMLFGPKTGFVAAIMFATLPGISLSAALISTDVPLLLCWAGAFYFFLRFLDDNSLFDALLMGAFIGAGLMAKYAMVYFILCMVIYALVARDKRGAIVSVKMLLALIVALLMLLPNLIWNAQNGFITARHTGDNIGWSGSFIHPLKTLEFLGSQFGVFGPILFAFLLIALVRFVREGWDDNQKLLVSFSIPVLALITMQALLSKAYANWAAATYVCATILIADIMVNRVPPLWNRLSLSIHAVIAVAIAVSVAFSAPGILTLADGRDIFARLHGWRELAQETAKRLDQGEFVGVVGGHRHLTAELVYYLRERKDPVFALRAGPVPHDHYEMTRPYVGSPEGALLLVSRNGALDRHVEQQFENVEVLGSHEMASGTIKHIWFFKLSRYRPNSK